MPITLSHEKASQRLHHRVTVPITITIDGKPYKAVDWGLGGCKIISYQGKLKTGNSLSTTLHIPFSGMGIACPAKAKVINHDPAQHTLNIEFVDLNARAQDLLTLFVEGLLKGEMEPVDGVIRRLDVPVTPPLLKRPLSEEAEARQERNRLLGKKIYTSVGIAVTFFLTFLLYHNIVTMTVRSAVVYVPTDVLLSPATGDITELYTEENTFLQKGTPILTITDPELESDIELATLAVEEATLNITHVDAKTAIEAERVAATEGIASKEWEAANRAVKAFESQLSIRQQAVNRMEALAKQGLVNKIQLDKERESYTKVKQDLEKAVQESSRLSTAIITAKKGFQVRNQRVEQGVADLLENGRLAKEQKKLAEQRLEMLKKQRERLTLRSPASGWFTRSLVLAGSAVKYGSPLGIFTHDTPPAVHAFVTPEQSLGVHAGMEAVVYFPTSGQSLTYKVKAIDAFSQSVNPQTGILNWNITPENKSVTIILESAPDQAVETAGSSSPGTPVEVTFRRWW